MYVRHSHLKIKWKVLGATDIFWRPVKKVGRRFQKIFCVLFQIFRFSKLWTSEKYPWIHSENEFLFVKVTNLPVSGWK